jgi:UDP-GlcNAc:undecaprenyl-phosphate GlcNAc-1-phosphate transferase
MPYHLVAFLISAFVVLWSTPLVKKIGLKTGYVDLPDPRKVHKRPMVRLGGVAIFIGNVSAWLMIWISGGFQNLPLTATYELLGVTLGGLLFFLIGLLDDLFTLSPTLRLFMQVVVAVLAWYVGVSIDFFTIPFYGLVQLGWLSLPFTVLWLVGMTNAMNFMDGLDGLAAGIAGIAAVIMLMVNIYLNQPIAAVLAAALAGGALGFLRYNFNPAQIFMGDGGAYFMGFTLAGLGIIGLVKSVTTVAVVLPFIILALPIIDTSTVVVTRISQGKSPFAADKRHLHHRLLQAGLPQRNIVLFLYAIAFWVGSLATTFAGLPGAKAYALGATGLLLYSSWQVWRRLRDKQDTQELP